MIRALANRFLNWMVSATAPNPAPYVGLPVLVQGKNKPRSILTADEIESALKACGYSVHATALQLGCSRTPIMRYVAAERAKGRVFGSTKCQKWRTIRALEGKPIGRPRLFTDKQINAALDLASGNQRQAARILGCGKHIVFKHVKRMKAK